MGGCRTEQRIGHANLVGWIAVVQKIFKAGWVISWLHAIGVDQDHPGSAAKGRPEAFRITVFGRNVCSRRRLVRHQDPFFLEQDRLGKFAVPEHIGLWVLSFLNQLVD